MDITYNATKKYIKTYGKTGTFLKFDKYYDNKCKE